MVLERMVLAVLACLVLTAAGCRDHECVSTEYELTETDVNVWGTVVGEDMAELLGPFEGTWTWLDGRNIIDVPATGEELPVTAYVEIDPTSYRYIEVDSIPGSPTPFPERMGCPSDIFYADGVMTVRGARGQTIAVVPLLIERHGGGKSNYHSYLEIEPISTFSAELQPLHEVDEEYIFTAVTWGGSLDAEFGYTGQVALPDTPEGHSSMATATAMIATFHQD